MRYPQSDFRTALEEKKERIPKECNEKVLQAVELGGNHC
jgi:hypothetical protein